MSVILITLSFRQLRAYLSRPVSVVGQDLCQAYWGDKSPLGKPKLGPWKFGH